MTSPVYISELLDRGQFIHISAPMVRYSRQPFRILCRKWGCNLAFSPMITCEEFLKSEQYRQIELTSSDDDTPLIYQFASHDPFELAEASKYVVGKCQGIDLNCGCPQKWAIKEGYGCALLNKPELVSDMIKQTISATNISISIKIRLQDDLRLTMELVKRASDMGVSWITVHGRTLHDTPNSEINYEAIKMIKDTLSIPVFGNGHCYNLDDVQIWKEKTGVDGIMAGRGLLENPALFKGFEVTPRECITDFYNLYKQYNGLNSMHFHHHLIKMMSRQLKKSEKAEFNILKSEADVVNYLIDNGWIIGTETSSTSNLRATKPHSTQEVKDIELE